MEVNIRTPELKEKTASSDSTGMGQSKLLDCQVCLLLLQKCFPQTSIIKSVKSELNLEVGSEEMREA